VLPVIQKEIKAEVEQRKMGKDVQDLKKQREVERTKRLLDERNREKAEEKAARDRVKRQIALVSLSVSSSSHPSWQDNMWKYNLNSRTNQAAIRAFEMTFVIGQKSYEGYEYYDFFEQVFKRLKGHPFQSNLTSEREVSFSFRVL